MRADNIHHLTEAARRRAQATRRRAIAALRRMDTSGLPVTIDALAHEAGVSRSWIYSQPDLRAEAERLRDRLRLCMVALRRSGEVLVVEAIQMTPSHGGASHAVVPRVGRLAMSVASANTIAAVSTVARTLRTMMYGKTPNNWPNDGRKASMPEEDEIILKTNGGGGGIPESPTHDWEDWREVREFGGEPDFGELDTPDLGEGWEREPAEPQEGDPTDPTRPPMAGGASPSGGGEGSSSPPAEDDPADADDGELGPGQQRR